MAVTRRVFQFGGTQEVGDLPRHVEGDRHLRGGGVLLDGGVVGQEVGDGREDRAAADAVVARTIKRLLVRRDR